MRKSRLRMDSTSLVILSKLLSLLYSPHSKFVADFVLTFLSDYIFEQHGNA
jgi:hypothetical protein